MVELISEQKFNSMPLAELEEGARWKLVGEEALHLLREYIRFPTVNDPESLDSEQMAHSPWLAGREAEAVQWLAGFLKSEGIATEVLEAAPGRLNLIARLSGTGHGRAVTLLSHSDVVPVRSNERDSGIDPFAASVLVAKSPCGFRAAYAERARKILVVKAPGCAPSDFWNYNYHHISHPLWPWDEIEKWQAEPQVFLGNTNLELRKGGI